MILSGRDVKLYIEAGKLKIEPVTDEQFQQNGVDLILESVKYKNHFPMMLGCTRETLALPDDLMAFVQIRSTWARSGFFLPPTIVDAGFHGNITLEILNFSNDALPIGQRFAHLIFAKTSGPCEMYRGKYSGQTGITDAIHEE